MFWIAKPTRLNEVPRNKANRTRLWMRPCLSLHNALVTCTLHLIHATVYCTWGCTHLWWFALLPLKLRVTSNQIYAMTGNKCKSSRQQRLMIGILTREGFDQSIWWHWLDMIKSYCIRHKLWQFMQQSTIQRLINLITNSFESAEQSISATVDSANQAIC